MSAMDFGFPAPSSSSSSDSDSESENDEMGECSSSDSDSESREMGECSSSEHSESEQSDTNNIPMHSDDSEKHKRTLKTMESLQPFVSMIEQQMEKMVREAFRDGGGGFSALPPLLRFDDDDTNNGDGDGLDDTNNGDGDGDGDGDYYPYLDIGEGSGNYGYGRAYLDLLLDALTNNPDTVHVVDGSYFQKVIDQFGSKYRFRYYRNREPFAQLYVNLPPSALPPQSAIIHPHPPPTSPSGGATDGNGSTICPTCHRKRSFDDNDSSSLNIEEGESSRKQQQEIHPQENKKFRHQAEMDESTIDQQQKQNCGKLDVISQPNRQETNNEEEKQDITANDGKHEQQKKGTDDCEKGNDNAQEKQNPDNRFKGK